ncbi:MAG: type II and III secretion system protein [Proteobacteria bacterium]|nr:type II and III secretion system protein [Pseudomonadota bacterium]
MKKKIAWIILTILLVGWAFPSTTMSQSGKTLKRRQVRQTEDVTMVVGEQWVLEAAEVASFSESTRGIIEVKVPRDGRRMIVTAVRSGTTSLLLIDRSGTERTILITVFSKSPDAITAELNELMRDFDELNLRRVGSKIFIDGIVRSKEALVRVEHVAKLYKGQVASLVQVDPNAVKPQTNIRLDLTFIGLRRRTGYNAGVSWPGTYGGTGALEGTLDLMTGSLTASYKVVDQALPALEAAARHGWVRIRKRATVMTISGNRATYEAGGEVNVAVAGSQAAELRTVPYGARLNVLPRLAKEQDILNLEVEAEISDLTETTQDVPGRTISRVKTLVHLGLGQSILLGGLDAESESSTKTGLPLLSRIPILGFFFGTTNHSEEKEEGLIVITPSVLDNIDQTGKRLLKEALAKFKVFKGNFKKLSRNK